MTPTTARPQSFQEFLRSFDSEISSDLSVQQAMIFSPEFYQSDSWMTSQCSVSPTLQHHGNKLLPLGPVMLLSDRSRVSKLVKCSVKFGRNPTRWFECRCSSCNFLDEHFGSLSINSVIFPYEKQPSGCRTAKLHRLFKFGIVVLCILLKEPRNSIVGPCWRLFQLRSRNSRCCKESRD